MNCMVTEILSLNKIVTSGQGGKWFANAKVDTDALQINYNLNKIF